MSSECFIYANSFNPYWHLTGIFIDEEAAVEIIEDISQYHTAGKGSGKAGMRTQAGYFELLCSPVSLDSH